MIKFSSKIANENHSFSDHSWDTEDFDETQDNESYLADDVSNPFMEEGNFDASLVSSPVETADTQHPAPHYVKGRHPYWKEVFGINLLIDPCGASSGLVTNSIIFDWLFIIKYQCKSCVLHNEGKSTFFIFTKSSQRIELVARPGILQYVRPPKEGVAKAGLQLLL